MKIKGRKYCEVCDKECSPYLFCSTICSGLAREYGRKKAREMIKNE